jgi:hypothetical protein
MDKINSLISDINTKLEELKDKDIKIYDDENPDFYITTVEYDEELKKVFFKCEEEE